MVMRKTKKKIYVVDIVSMTQFGRRRGFIKIKAVNKKEVRECVLERIKNIFKKNGWEFNVLIDKIRVEKKRR